MFFFLGGQTSPQKSLIFFALVCFAALLSGINRRFEFQTIESHVKLQAERTVMLCGWGVTAGMV